MYITKGENKLNTAFGGFKFCGKRKTVLAFLWVCTKIGFLLK